MSRALACLATCALLATGCTNLTRVGAHDAAVPGDALVPCGLTTCGGGDVCCNVSCGICAPPGESCLELPCTDAGVPSCGGDDATLSGGCSSVLYAWNGTGCVSLVGCTCSGRDCDRLQTTEPDCYAEHASCWTSSCEVDGTPCPTGYFCEVTSCEATSGTCARVPARCEDVVEPVVCGCDATPYASTCAARAARVGHDGSIACGLCDASIPGVGGSCSVMLGYAWDGATCTLIRGCSCTSACDRLYDTLDDCTAALAPCIRFPCEDESCVRYDEICVVTKDGGSRCDPLPGECEGVPQCSCIPGVASCNEQGPGALVVTPS